MANSNPNSYIPGFMAKTGLCNKYDFFTAIKHKNIILFVSPNWVYIIFFKRAIEEMFAWYSIII